MLSIEYLKKKISLQYISFFKIESNYVHVVRTGKIKLINLRENNIRLLSFIILKQANALSYINCTIRTRSNRYQETQDLAVRISVIGHARLNWRVQNLRNGKQLEKIVGSNTFIRSPSLTKWNTRNILLQRTVKFLNKSLLGQKFKSRFKISPYIPLSKLLSVSNIIEIILQIDKNRNPIHRKNRGINYDITSERLSKEVA